MTDARLPRENPSETISPAVPLAQTRAGSCSPGALACLLTIQLALSNLSVSAQEFPGPEEPRLRQVVTDLASPNFAGRSGAGGQKAAAYLVDRFRTLKLEPLFGRDYRQAIPGKEPGTVIGHNVAAACQAAIPSSRTNGLSWPRTSIIWECETATFIRRR